jgi:hypothetical protein
VAGITRSPTLSFHTDDNAGCLIPDITIRILVDKVQPNVSAVDETIQQHRTGNGGVSIHGSLLTWG